VSEHELIVAAVFAVGILLAIVGVRTWLMEHVAGDGVGTPRTVRRPRAVFWLDVAGLVFLMASAVLLVLRIIAGLPHH
jgi:hypothetical protein